jgi:hypothetical protein
VRERGAGQGEANRLDERQAAELLGLSRLLSVTLDAARLGNISPSECRL